MKAEVSIVKTLLRLAGRDVFADAQFDVWRGGRGKLFAMRRREWSSRMPYGPYIALAAAIWVFGGKRFFHALFAM
jgi:prepilin signal peptidase PulO-like enzyme (type II secretory pathway)